MAEQTVIKIIRNAQSTVVYKAVEITQSQPVFWSYLFTSLSDLSKISLLTS